MEQTISQPNHMHPRHFLWEYVEPSIQHFYKNAWTEHLAIHAITQTDILAEITAQWLGMKARHYRNDLRVRRPVLGIIQDAHDTHKHGMLDRPNATFISKGQRPATAIRYGFFFGVSYFGGPPSPYKTMELTLNDGERRSVSKLLDEALRGWTLELDEKGIPESSLKHGLGNGEKTASV